MTIATGKLSMGGYIGPVVAVVATPGFRTVIVDPVYASGLCVWDVRVSRVGDDFCAIEQKHK